MDKESTGGGTLDWYCEDEALTAPLSKEYLMGPLIYQHLYAIENDLYDERDEKIRLRTRSADKDTEKVPGIQRRPCLF